MVDGRLVVSPAEKRKRKRLAAKATNAISVAEASNVTKDAKVVLTIKGPPKSTGAIPKVLKPSMAGRQKLCKAGQGPSREEKGPGGC